MAALRRRASSSSTTASTCCSAGCRATDRYWLGVLTPSRECSSCAAEESGERLHVSPTSESSMWLRPAKWLRQETRAPQMSARVGTATGHALRDRCDTPKNNLNVTGVHRYIECNH